MKQILLAFAVLIATITCAENKQATPLENNIERGSEVPFKIAKNYFFKNGNDAQLKDPKITSEKTFHDLFGMATTMGPDGKPTDIDFNKQFVLAIVLPLTDKATEIFPIKVEEDGNSLYYTYEVTTGEKLSYIIQPVSIIILDKRYKNQEVILKEKKEFAGVTKKNQWKVPDDKNKKVYDVVEQMPSFPGGNGALMEFLNENTHFPLTAKEQGIQGRVVVSFIIEEDGSLTDIQVCRSVDSALDKEAIRVVRSMPNWIPGRQNGKPTRVKYNVPVSFRLQ